MVDDNARRARYDPDAGFGVDVVFRPGTSGGASRVGTAGGRLGTGTTRAQTAASSATGSGGGGAYNVIVLTENRSREVGAAIVNLAALHTIELVQLADSPSYSQTQALLHVVGPVEIVVPKSQVDRVLFKKVRPATAFV